MKGRRCWVQRHLDVLAFWHVVNSWVGWAPSVLLTDACSFKMKKGGILHASRHVRWPKPWRSYWGVQGLVSVSVNAKQDFFLVSMCCQHKRTILMLPSLIFNRGTQKLLYWTLPPTFQTDLRSFYPTEAVMMLPFNEGLNCVFNGIFMAAKAISCFSRVELTPPEVPPRGQWAIWLLGTSINESSTRQWCPWKSQSA